MFLLAWCATACFLLQKCRYGVGNIDESFNLTIPMRLLQGDALFLHEWHLSQMSGWLMTPFVALVRGLKQGTEGIILIMRCIITLLQCLLGLAIYLRLRKYNRLGAGCAALSFMIYTPFGVMAMSYNSLGILLLAASGLLLLPSDRHTGVCSFLSGLAFAMAVLCCPYLLLVYFVYIAAAVIRAFARSKSRAENAGSFLDVGNVIRFTVGAVLVALVFAAFVLSNASLDGILQAFPHMMNDPEHPSLSVVAKIVEYVEEILRATPYSRVLYPLIALLFVVCLFDRRRKSRRCVYFIPALACTMLLMVDHYHHWQYLNMTMWSVNMMGVFVLLLTDRSINRRLFQLIWIPGMLYSFCLHLSSNQTFHAMTSASTVATLASVAMLAIFADEVLKTLEHKTIRSCICILLCLTFGFQIFSEADLRWRKVFWEDGIHTQTVPITEGPQAGLLVSEEKAQQYADALRRLEVMEPYTGKKVLFLSKNTWYYLIHDCEMAAYSAWLSGVNEHTVARLEAYYAINPDKLPDAVYADAEDAQIALLLGEKLGYSARQTDGGIILEK